MARRRIVEVRRGTGGPQLPPGRHGQVLAIRDRRRLRRVSIPQRHRYLPPAGRVRPGHPARLRGTSPPPTRLFPSGSGGTAVGLGGTLRWGSGGHHLPVEVPRPPAYTLLFRRSATSLFPTALGARLNVIRIR